MKKGIVGSIIGFIFFFLAFGIISFDGGYSTMFSVLPVIVVFGIIFSFRKVAKEVKNKEEKHNSHFDNAFSSMTECNSCHSPIEASANYCPVCGATQDSTIKCEYCGHVNPSTNALCEKCNGFL